MEQDRGYRRRRCGGGHLITISPRRWGGESGCFRRQFDEGMKEDNSVISSIEVKAVHNIIYPAAWRTRHTHQSSVSQSDKASSTRKHHSMNTL